MNSDVLRERRAQIADNTPEARERLAKYEAVWQDTIEYAARLEDKLDGWDEARAERDQAINALKMLRSRSAIVKYILDANHERMDNALLQQGVENTTTLDLARVQKMINGVLSRVEQGDTMERIRHDTLHDVLDRLESHIERNAKYVSPSTAASCWEVVNAMLPEGKNRALATDKQDTPTCPYCSYTNRLTSSGYGKCYDCDRERETADDQEENDE